MDIDGKGIGILGIMTLAFIIVGVMLSNGWLYLMAGLTFVILLAGIFFGAGGSMRIKNFGR
jgi:hypothetical protein